MVFEAPGRSNVQVWSSRAVVCEPRRPGLVGPPGFHTTTGGPTRAHLRVPVIKNTIKIQREDPQRGKKRTKVVAGEGGKKERHFGRSGGGGPAEGVRQRVQTNNHTTNTNHRHNNKQQTTTHNNRQQHTTHNNIKK